MSSDLPAGEPLASYRAEELADIVALTDGSLWSYEASVGGFTSSAHDDVICRDGAAVAAHTGGAFRMARKEDYLREE